MSNRTHTPEPWDMAWNVPDGRGGTMPFNVCEDSDGTVTSTLIARNVRTAADMERIVRCVNFCAGFSDEELQKMVSLKAVDERLKKAALPWANTLDDDEYFLGEATLAKLRNAKLNTEDDTEI
jgi:hypothetical protein